MERAREAAKKAREEAEAKRRAAAAAEAAEAERKAAAAATAAEKERLRQQAEEDRRKREQEEEERRAHALTRRRENALRPWTGRHGLVRNQESLLEEDAFSRYQIAAKRVDGGNTGLSGAFELKNKFGQRAY